LTSDGKRTLLSAGEAKSTFPDQYNLAIPNSVPGLIALGFVVDSTMIQFKPQ
jgi:hypothetical protein